MRRPGAAAFSVGGEVALDGARTGGGEDALGGALEVEDGAGAGESWAKVDELDAGGSAARRRSSW